MLLLNKSLFNSSLWRITTVLRWFEMSHFLLALIYYIKYVIDCLKCLYSLVPASSTAYQKILLACWDWQHQNTGIWMDLLWMCFMESVLGYALRRIQKSLCRSIVACICISEFKNGRFLCFEKERGWVRYTNHSSENIHLIPTPNLKIRLACKQNVNSGGEKTPVSQC